MFYKQITVLKEEPVISRTYGGGDTPFSKGSKAVEVRYQKIEVEVIDTDVTGSRCFSKFMAELRGKDIDTLAAITPDPATGLKVIAEACVLLSSREWEGKKYNDVKLYIKS